VPRHAARLVSPLVVINFEYAARPGSSARHAACHAARRAARRRLLRLHCASGCLGPSRGSSSTTLTMPRVRVPRHVARLVSPLVVINFDYAACLGSSARHAARHAARRAARRRLLRLHRASRCLGPSRGSSSTTSPTPRLRVPRHVA
jgi:hypothetical protein